VRGYRVLRGDAQTLLGGLLSGPDAGEAAEGGVLLVDPPRTGLTPGVTRHIARSAFPLVLYLSCDPRTHARDLSDMVRSGPWKVREIQPFDMFPQTFHVECLAVVQRESR